MQSSIIHIVEGEEFLLHPHKVIIWRSQKSIVVSDLHIGKAGHFRANGVNLPQETNSDNLWRLSSLIQDFEIEQLIIVGDLFHSKLNSEWDEFCDFLEAFPKVKTILVKGNHDVLDEDAWNKANLDVVDHLFLGPFQFVHELEDAKDSGYVICGHVHPSVRLVGNGRQSLRLPCFYFGTKHSFLPAFGYFTGTHRIKPTKNDAVFVIAENKVLKV